MECDTCHDISTWQALRAFDHDRTQFGLAGVHRTVPCSGCHQRKDGSPGIDGVTFSGAPLACAGCHEDVHAGQFDEAGRPQICSQCHSNTDWQPTQFDHRKYSAFPLDGAHERVPCRSCHSQRQQRDGIEAILYRGTPRACAACHADKP